MASVLAEPSLWASGELGDTFSPLGRATSPPGCVEVSVEASLEGEELAGAWTFF